MTPVRTVSPILVVGTGLLGTSVALGLRSQGVDVLLNDASPVALGLAADYGAGRIAPATSATAAATLDDAEANTPKIVVVCVPPDVAGQVVMEQLTAWPDAIVTDVTSVKAAPLDYVREHGGDLRRYLGSHPMAGRETGGPLAGRANLFLGRPWVITSHAETSVQALQEIEGLALDLGATVVNMDAEAHDSAVALISHVPQLVSSVMAAQLLNDDAGASALAGGGLRDVTRIAASDPTMWNQILAANGPRVATILRDVASDITELATALEDMSVPGARRIVADHMIAGNQGVARIPGKHGISQTFATFTVMIDDAPGQLAKLFSDIGEVEVNVEELQIEHAPGANMGLAQISVLPESLTTIMDELRNRDWKVAE